jgi:hypothetical protein
MPDALGTAIDIRAGVSQISKQAETRIEFSKPFESACTVAVTEWRNEPSNAVHLTKIYIMQVDTNGFRVGHEVWNRPGFDQPSFGWIASTIR